MSKAGIFRIGAVVLLAVLGAFVSSCERPAAMSPDYQAERFRSTEKSPNILHWGNTAGKLDKIQSVVKHIDNAQGGELYLNYGGTSATWPHAFFSGDNLELGIVNGSSLGGSATITGSACYYDDIFSIPGVYSITGSVTELSSNFDMPQVNWGFFKNEAQAAGQFVDGTKVFDASGSPYSGVWYVTGEALIYENVVINGTIVSEYDCELLGDNITVTAVPANYPALIASRKLKVYEDNIHINGLIYSEYYVKFRGDNDVLNGAVISHNDIECSGNNLQINHDPAYTTNLQGISFGPSVAENASAAISFKILPNAMEQSSDIAISMDDAQLLGGVDLVFGPHGTTFAPAAYLNIEVCGLDLSSVDPATINVYYDDPASGTWELMPSSAVIVDQDRGRVQVVDARLPHFSRYAIGAD